MEWYVKNGISLNLNHFLIRARDSGDWKENNISKDEFMKLLQDRIENISFKSIREDIVRFIRDDKVLEIWSANYFKDLIKKIKFK